MPDDARQNIPDIVAENPAEGLPTAPKPTSEAGLDVAAPDASTKTPDKPLPSLLRNRDYMLLWSGQVVSALGSGISGLAFPILVLVLTNNDYTAAGIAAALGGIPYLIFSLPVGALIDRWNRKHVMILCDAGRALSLASVPIALFFNALTLWQLYINAFIEGSLFVFFNIAEVASLSRVVDKKQLPNASAQNEAGLISANIIAPSLGGVLLAWGRIFPFVIDTISYVVSVISLLFIKVDFQGERKPVEDRNLRREIGEGLRWLWGNPLIRYMAFLTGGGNFTFSGTALIMIALTQQLAGEKVDASHLGPQVGLIFSIGAIGGVIGALIGGRIQKRFKFGQVIITVMWVQAILFPLYAVAPHIILLGVISALIFMTAPIYNVVQFSYRLALIPDELQGRVNSTFRLLAYGFQPLGGALSGILLSQLGVVPTLVVFMVVLFALSILTTVNSHVRNARPIEEVVAKAAAH